MDCGIARERLDAARSDPQDREDSELQTAFAHLDECPACAEAYEFHRAFDRRVGEIIRRVDVPADLQSRLREALASHATLPQPETPRADDIRSSRRALLISASAATLLIAAGVNWYVGHREPAPLTAATVLDWWGLQLMQTKNFDPRTLPAFDGSFVLNSGDPRWLELSRGEPRGADIDNDGRHDAAVVPIPGGFLVVMPAGRVTDPPTAGAAGGASLVYTPALHVAWTYKNSMHVCYLPGGSSPRQLQQLLDKVYGSAA